MSTTQCMHNSKHATFPAPVCSSLLSQSIFTDPEQRLQSDDEYVHLRSGYRINILIRLILTFIIVALLLVPTSILFLVKGNNGLKFFVISAFTILFAGMLHVGTKAQRYEVSTMCANVLLIHVLGRRYSQVQRLTALS